MQELCLAKVMIHGLIPKLALHAREVLIRERAGRLIVTGRAAKLLSTGETICPQVRQSVYRATTIFVDHSTDLPFNVERCSGLVRNPWKKPC